MIKKIALLAFLASLLFVSSFDSWGAQAKEKQNQLTSAPNEFLARFYKEQGRAWRITWSAKQERIASLLGRGTKVYQGTPSEMVQSFLRENVRLLGLKDDLSDLKIISARKGPGGSNIEYRQYYQDVPVENAFIKVNTDQSGRVVQVTNSYVPGLKIELVMTINKEKGVELAIDRFLQITPARPSRKPAQEFKPVLKVDLKLKEAPKVDRVLFMKDGRPFYSYKVLIKASRPFGLKEFIVDGQSGAILRVRDFIRSSVNGQGRVFIPNPICVLNDGTLRDQNDAAAAVPNAAYATVTLLDLDDALGGVYRLSGPFVRSEEIEAPARTQVTEAAPNFNYDRDQDGFEEVMLYYHIDRNQRYIQSLGFVDVNNRQIRVDAHGCDDEDNAWYYPDPVGGGYLAFGDGGSDGAEDADMILHEYGHSIQDNQTLSKYLYDGQTGAMGEGFGDYWAFSNFYAESLASGWDPACYSEWDAVNYDGDVCERNLNNTKVYPGDYINDVWTDGEIWSGTLRDIFNSLGKTTADRLVLQGHFNVPDNPSFKDGADAIMTADLQFFYGSHLDALCQIFQARGFYGAADCPQIAPSTGNQDALIILLQFNEEGLPASPLDINGVNGILNKLNAYLDEVTYHQVSLNPTIKGWYNLPHDRAYYYDQTARNLLIELVQDALDAVEPGFDFTPFERMILITNDDGSGGETRGQQDWATTGPWPYELPAALGTKRLSVSVHSYNQSDGQFTHALGHHFGLIDLYPHEGITFPRPYADGWSNMAKDAAGQFNNSHFLGWEKRKPAWLDDGDILFIPRPPADPDPNHEYNDTIPIYLQESDGPGREIIQIGTTDGIADRSEERVSYYLEARAKAGPYDGNIPDSGVLVYYLNEDISQGFGPLRLVDATPGDGDLTNAALHVGDALADIDGTHLSVEVLAATGSEAYRVHIVYDPPEDEVDVWIHARDENWQSQDIWVDAPPFEADLVDHGDKPKPGSPNHLYARVFNHGPGTAHNVRIDFWLSDPYHGIDGGGVDPDTGGNVAFNKHYFAVVDDLPPTDAGVPVSVDWTPEAVPEGQSYPHACVKVKIAQVFNDTNDQNQASQENIHEYDTAGGSPYAPVVNPFVVVNPYDHPILVYLRADNVPAGWQTEIVPKKAFLAVGGSVNAQITIQPPEDYLPCSTEFVTVSAWYPSGDTLIQLGGTAAQVNLKKRVVLDFQTSVGPCREKKAVLYAHVQETSDCQVITTRGCTNPPLPNEHITLEYTGPDGNPIYHEVTTDANGCFEDFLVNPQGGFWQVDAEYPGNECYTAAEPPERTVIVPPRPPHPIRGMWYSFHLGLNFPLGEFNTSYDPGPSLSLDFEYKLMDNTSVLGILGFHYFHGPADGRDMSWTNVSANVRRYVPILGWRWFIQGGLGLYIPNSGSNRLGLNLGTGLNFLIDPRLALELGLDYHWVGPGHEKRSFFDLRMGLLFRF